MVAVHEHPRALLIHLELDIATRMDTERPPNLERDRDLPLLRHTHIVRLASNTWRYTMRKQASREMGIRRYVSVRSQKTKPSRSTTSPVAYTIGSEKIGPAWTKVWNSPFSPHGINTRGQVGEKLLVIRSAREGDIERARVQADDDRLEAGRDELIVRGCRVAAPKREEAALAGRG